MACRDSRRPSRWWWWSPTFMKNCWRWRRGEVSSAVVGALDRLGLFHTWRQINSSIHSIALPTSCSCYKSWVKTDLRTSSKARSTHLSTQVEEGGVEYSIAQFYLSNCLEDYIELAYFNLECVYLNGPKLSIVWLEKNELYAINYPRKYLLEKTRCEWLHARQSISSAMKTVNMNWATCVNNGIDSFSPKWGCTTTFSFSAIIYEKIYGKNSEKKSMAPTLFL